MRSLFALTLVAAAPLAAQSPITQAQRAVPPQLSSDERSVFARAFLDAQAGRIGPARSALDAYPSSVLAPALRAQITLARGGKKALPVDAVWLATNPDLPQAGALASLALAAGATGLPALPRVRAMPVTAFDAPMTPRPVRPATADEIALAPQLRALIERDAAAEAEAALLAATGISAEFRAEWAQRTAWDHYQLGDDAGAQRVAQIANGVGEWGALANWTAGLAAWRSGDCKRASSAFDAAGGGSADQRAASAFWAYRAYSACGKPTDARTRLNIAAAAAPTGFYGILARHRLGLGDASDWAEPDFIQADWTSLSRLPGARRAAALVEIGQLGLADRELRHLAATAPGETYQPVLRLAARLNMPATQYWLAHRPPAGASAPLSARFPAPEWTPARGWRVDRGLVFAHALQESNFITDATSRAGARGVMQLMPGTAKKVARDMGVDADPAHLADPAFNIEYGQTYLEELRDSPHTGGLLPKVIAAYNAGPGSVRDWNATLRDNGDPLLFIESIPFRETRHYVEVVLRNYWMYSARAGAATPSLDALATNLWPRFPGLPGETAVRVTPSAPPTQTLAARAE
jgi:soluble lytic murein transglycosylase-like protein